MKGRIALKAREAAVALKIDTWRADANGVRRGVETALDDHANKSGLNRDDAGRFFPSPRAATTKPAAPPVT